MATIINSPPSSSDNGMGGIIVGVFVLIVLGFLFFYFGLPAIRRTGSIEPQINVPNQIDVNVKQTP